MRSSLSSRSRRKFLQGSFALTGLGLLAGCGIGHPGQQAAKVPRIGYLALGTEMTVPEQAFRDGLRELGYLEGQTILIEERRAESGEQLPALAAELVGLPVDLIVAASGGAIQAALGATSTIPIVFPASGDPVQAGYVASLARPGGNATGLSNLAVEAGAKRLQLLRDTVPGVSRVLLLVDTADPATDDSRGARETAQALGLQLLRPTLRSAEELPVALDVALTEHAEALMVGGQSFITRERGRIIEFAARHRLPAMYDRRQIPNEGGLMSYGVDVAALYRRAATYVDKILKGTKPADLPVERPTTFEFVINLKTAQALGLTIPLSVLQQATEIIQ